MAMEQLADPAILSFKTAESSLPFEEVSFHDSGATLLCNVSAGRSRLLVPAAWRWRVFEVVHSLSHRGVKALVKLVGENIVWPSLRKDIWAWRASCMACQRAKVQQQGPTGQLSYSPRKVKPGGATSIITGFPSSPDSGSSFSSSFFILDFLHLCSTLLTWVYTAYLVCQVVCFNEHYDLDIGKHLLFYYFFTVINCTIFLCIS